jgi:hypothetical protein
MKKNESVNEEKFAIPYKNIYLIIGGLLLMIIGYVCMTGGGSDNPDIFREKELFSFTRIVIAPLLILAGFAAEIAAIMYKPKKNELD